MRDSSNKLVLLLFGGLTCLAFTSTGNADGRLFELTLENATGLMGFREAERACASLHARLASAAELRHAVVECFFSTCTRGWLYGGTVGTTVCNVVGSTLKAVGVKTENATEDFAHLNAFCIKDRGVPCGDPPSFPNTRLQGHSGYEMGDELLYTCAPGFVMPSRHKAFSLLCDSCGEWYGLVETCLKDEAEGLVDYEDKFPDADGGLEDRDQRAEEANSEVQEEVHGAAHPGWEPRQQHQESTFSLGQAHADVREEGDVAANGEKEEEQAVGDFIGQPMSEQEQPGVTPDAATEAPVSLLSQKHMFWFPSEAFQDEVSQRDSTIQSEESKENESQEMNNSQKPIDPDDSHQESDHYVSHDTDDHRDLHDGHHDDHHEHDTRQDYGDHGDQPRPHTPAQHEVQDGLDHPGNQDNGDDHYDMGEHDEDHSPTRYGSQENDDTYDEHESYEDHEDETEDRRDDQQEHVEDSQEHPDHDDNDDLDGDEDHYNQKVDDRDHYTDDDHDDLSDDHDHNDHDDLSDGQHDHDDHGDLSDDHYDHEDHDDDHEDHRDHDEQHHHHDHDDRGDDHDDHDDYDDQHHHDDDHDDLNDRTDENDHDDGNDHNDQDDPLDSDDHSDHKDDDQNSYEDADSQEEVKDRDYHVIFSITRDHHQNISEVGGGGGGGGGGKATTDETWLDGYPVVATQMEDEDSMGERSKDEDKDAGAFNQVEGQKPVSHTSSPEESKPSSKEPPFQQGGGQEMWPGFIPTANPTFTSYRGPAAPTQQSFINHDPAPPVRDSDAIMEEHTMNNLPGESGERSEMEGEMGETVCTGENCPPPASAGQSSKVASIIVVVCLVAIAVMVGVWCYRRQQQKSSVYEMNGKGQSQSRPAQQMEMQQKV